MCLPDGGAVADSVRRKKGVPHRRLAALDNRTGTGACWGDNRAKLIDEAVKKYFSTFIFNAFVYMQVFNLIKARAPGQDMSAFDGIMKNPFFIAIFFVTAVVGPVVRVPMDCVQDVPHACPALEHINGIQCWHFDHRVLSEAHQAASSHNRSAHRPQKGENGPDEIVLRRNAGATAMGDQFPGREWPQHPVLTKMIVKASIYSAVND
jgi:hypothetical protein